MTVFFLYVCNYVKVCDRMLTGVCLLVCLCMCELVSHVHVRGSKTVSDQRLHAFTSNLTLIKKRDSIHQSAYYIVNHVFTASKTQKGSHKMK